MELPLFSSSSKRLLLILLPLILSFWGVSNRCVASGIFDLGTLHFETIGSDKQIPGGIVTAIAQDKAGFMWIGTQDGLVRFDGYNYVKYSHDSNYKNSLLSSYIRSIWVAADGKLWVASRASGITVFDPANETFTHLTHDPEVPDSLSENRINTIIGDNHGGIWIATNNGLNFISKNSPTVQRFYSDTSSKNSLNHNYVRSLLIDKNNVLWVGSQGLNTIDLNKFYATSSISDRKKLIRKKFSSTAKPEKIDSLHITSLLQSTNGSIWFGTKFNGGGRIQLDNTIQYLNYKNDQQGKRPSHQLNYSWVTSIIEVTGGRVWFATFGGGIDEVNETTGRVTHRLTQDSSVNSSLALNQVGTMAKDSSGMIWVGTWGGGLSRHNPQGAAFKILHRSLQNKYSLTQSDILSIWQIKNSKNSNKHADQFWIGTRSNGIDIIDPSVGVIANIQADPTKKGFLKGNQIREITQAPDGTIWVAEMQTGIYRYNQEDQKFEHFGLAQKISSRSILTINFIEDNNPWVGTSLGLNRLNPESNLFDKFYETTDLNTPFKDSIDKIIRTSDGTTWLASDGGLLIKKKGALNFTRIVKHSGVGSLSHNLVTNIKETQTGDILVSTYIGVDRLSHWEESNPYFEPVDIKVKTQEYFSWPNMIESESHTFWDSFGWFNYKTLEFYRFSESEGVDIGTNWFGSYHKATNGTLLFGGTRGILMIKPHLFSSWEFKPNIVVSTLSIDGETKSSYLLNELEIKPGTKSFTIGFSSLDYSEPTKNSYSYKLQGFNTDWININSEHRQATYTNLEPGEYELRVKGSNRLGMWSPNKLTIKINVLPKWYQTLWFKLTVIVIFSLFLYLLYLFRVKALKQHKADLQKQVLERTTKLEIFADIGKELSSTLEVDEIISRLYHHLNKFIDSYVFAIGICVPDKNIIQFEVALENGVTLPLHSESFSEKNKLAVYCVVENTEIIAASRLERLKILPDSISYPLKKTVESVVYIPLYDRRRKVLGCLTVQHTNKNAFSQNQIEMLRSLASYTSIALDNADAYHQLQEHSLALEKQQLELELARDKAQQAVVSKGVFLANMSHEIRTPMHGILGMVDFVKKTLLDTEQSEYINNIQLSAETLLTVVNDIMDFSKVEAGKMEIEELPFALSKLIEKTKAIIGTLANQKGLVVKFEISKETPTDLVGDLVRINQVLLNLCSNAIKFTHQGEIQIRLSSKSISNNPFKCWLCIDVIDQGIGISDEAIERLFESFSQADSTTSRQYGGTGLGLAISRFLAEKMGGDIEVSSKLGVGSHFKFTAQVGINEQVYGEKLLQFSKNLKMLLIDDEEQSASTLSSKLSNMNTTVTICTHISEALKQIMSPLAKIDVVLLNWNQIEQSPSECDDKNNTHCEFVERFIELKNKKQLEQNCNLIIYSEFNRTLISKLCPVTDAKDGVTASLMKPLSFVQLHETIEQSKNLLATPEDSLFPLRNLTLLVAEDNKINQMIVVKMLKGLGATVELTDNGEDAWRLAQNNKYDLVLMDIHMPRMDGIEATKKILNDSKCKGIKVVAMTANVVPKDVKFYLSVGMVGHLSKPFNSKRIVKEILNHITSP